MVPILLLKTSVEIKSMGVYFPFLFFYIKKEPSMLAFQPTFWVHFNSGPGRKY